MHLFSVTLSNETQFVGTKPKVHATDKTGLRVRKVNHWIVKVSHHVGSSHNKQDYNTSITKKLF